MARAGIIFAAIALLDWGVVGAIPLGFLYLAPMLLVGSVLGSSQILVIALLCTGMAEAFDDFTWTPRTGLPRDVLYFAAFAAVGLFVREMSRNRLTALDHLHEVEHERDARRDAEEQLKALIESSPAAIVTADANGVIMMANGAACRMFALSDRNLTGKILYSFLPSLTNASRHVPSDQFFRTVMQARGQRDDGETFLADICFSTYRTSEGPRITAMVLDASEDLRTHEVAGLHQLMAGSRIAMSAVSHEIRNVCAAIAIVHKNLAQEGRLAGSEDFDALGSLVVSLERIASINLQQSSGQATEVDLVALLDELKIIMGPLLHEENISTEWVISPALPKVWADRSSLMQVFLNILMNSNRALASRYQQSRIKVVVKSSLTQVQVEFSDNGGGVAHADQLFHPFQPGATSTGLGLYLSRALMRSFGGDLHYRPLGDGACFIVDLNASTVTTQRT